jgi:hypothetical protein
MGIGCAVMSYAGHLYVTLVADTKAASDVVLLRNLMRQAFDELLRVTLDEERGGETASDRRAVGLRAVA